MSLPVFIDTSIEEQLQELRAYFNSMDIASNKESKSHKGEELKHLISVCDLVFEKNNLTDAESILNSIVAIIFTIDPKHASIHVENFSEKLSQPSNPKIGSVCFRVLISLYHALEECIPLSYEVYYNLIKLCSPNLNNDILDIYQDLDTLKTWFEKNQLPSEQTKKILRLLYEVLLESKQNQKAYEVMEELLSSYTEENSSQAREDSHKFIVACLADQNTYVMNNLLLLQPIKFLEGELIHDLLSIFVYEKLEAYFQFYEVNKDFVDSLGLSHVENIKKMRLLTFLTIAEFKKELSYEEVQKELAMDADDLEEFIIDALATKMIQVKLNQRLKKVKIISVKKRSYSREFWLDIKEKFIRWISNIDKVETNMQQANLIEENLEESESEEN